MAYGRRKDSPEVVVFFKTHLREGADRAAYEALDRRMSELVSGLPGFRSIKGFVAEDGERISIVRFASVEALEAWRSHPEHREAQRRGREEFYDHYWVQVCKVVREYEFELERGPEPPEGAGPGRAGT